VAFCATRITCAKLTPIRIRFVARSVRERRENTGHERSSAVVRTNIHLGLFQLLLFRIPSGLSLG